MSLINTPSVPPVSCSNGRLRAGGGGGGMNENLGAISSLKSSFGLITDIYQVSFEKMVLDCYVVSLGKAFHPTCLGGRTSLNLL